MSGRQNVMESVRDAHNKWFGSLKIVQALKSLKAAGTVHSGSRSLYILSSALTD